MKEEYLYKYRARVWNGSKIGASLIRKQFVFVLGLTVSRKQLMCKLFQQGLKLYPSNFAGFSPQSRILLKNESGALQSSDDYKTTQNLDSRVLSSFVS